MQPAGEGRAIVEFSGKELVRGEPDASSFPSGGIRATFEARGYTAWDPTSPAFIMEGPNGATLVIPTAFLSWTGEALDKKTPLLRSMEALSKQAPAHPSAVRQSRSPEGLHHRRSGAGILPDRQELLLRPARPDQRRPDALRRPPPKGQELEDQYFGTIPERVLACMADAEAELFKLGVPVKTRHNEVAPSQYEIAPIFEDSQSGHRSPDADDGGAAQDGEQVRIGLPASTRSRSPASTARASTTTGRCPPTPARTCSTPATRRTTTLSSWSSAWRSSVPWRSIPNCCACRWRRRANDHRLGANEAPPAIISIFLGDQLQDVIDQLEQGAAKSTKQGGFMEIGVSVLPQAAARCRRPQPHQPVRLHRQQVRVPRRRRLAVDRRPEHGAEHHRGRVAGLHRHASGEGQGERQGLQPGHAGSAAGHHQGEQEGAVQRRQLHCRMARGGREARPAEPRRRPWTLCR